MLLVVIVELHVAGGLYKVLLALVTVRGHLAVLVHLSNTLLDHNRVQELSGNFRKIWLAKAKILN